MCQRSKQQLYDISFKYETDGHFDLCGPAVTTTIPEGVDDPTLTDASVGVYTLDVGECYTNKKRYLSKFMPSFQDCATACRRATECDIFSWHNATQVSPLLESPLRSLSDSSSPTYPHPYAHSPTRPHPHTPIFTLAFIVTTSPLTHSHLYPQTLAPHPRAHPHAIDSRNAALSQWVLFAAA